LFLIRSRTILTFLGDMRAYLKYATACIGNPPFGRYFVLVALLPEWPLKVLVGENSPSL